MMDLRYRRIWLPFHLLFLLAFPLGMMYVESRPPAQTTTCIFRLTTGLDCPSCGLTRGFRAMGRLDVRSAFRYNPLGPAVFLGALAYWCYVAGMVITGGRVQLTPWWQRYQARILWSALAIFLLVGMGRIGYELRHPPPPAHAPNLPFLRWVLPRDSGELPVHHDR